MKYSCFNDRNEKAEGMGIPRDQKKINLQYMKRILVFSFLVFLVFLPKKSSSQVLFWYETFGLGCSQGALAQGASPTPTNGLWSVVNTGANGAQANEWFVSATEAGRPPGTCGNGCLNNAGLTNRSLHIGSNVPGPGFDVGA